MDKVLTPLCELAKKYSTDKGGWHFTYDHEHTDRQHNYTPIYYDLFKGREQEVDSVLEIGINKGCSLRMWKEFFPESAIIGLDSNLKNTIESPEDFIFWVKADQGNKKSLLKALETCGMEDELFDLIVDDGSHEPDHQVTSLQTLSPFLKIGGYYTIEDLKCSEGELYERSDLDTSKYFWDYYKCDYADKGVEGQEYLIVVKRCA